MPVSITELLTLLEALQARTRRRQRRALLPSGAHLPGQGRALLRPIRPGLRRAFQGGGATCSRCSQRELPADWLEKIGVARPDRGRKGRRSRPWAAGRSSWRRSSSAWRSSTSGIRAATSGSAPPAPRRSAPTATTRKACASARTGRGNRSAVKVWDRREFANLDDTVELGTRNMKMALRRLRRFARRGAPTELALADTIDATARSGGWLDIKMVPERHNVVKVLLLLDVGGSMDDHVQDLRGAVLGRAQRIQASRAFLFPQLSLRGPVARQPAALQRARRHGSRSCAPMAPTTS